MFVINSYQMCMYNNEHQATSLKQARTMTSFTATQLYNFLKF